MKPNSAWVVDVHLQLRRSFTFPSGQWRIIERPIFMYSFSDKNRLEYGEKTYITQHKISKKSDSKVLSDSYGGVSIILENL